MHAVVTAVALHQRFGDEIWHSTDPRLQSAAAVDKGRGVFRNRRVLGRARFFAENRRIFVGVDDDVDIAQ
jgi:hypothetical protein